MVWFLGWLALFLRSEIDNIRLKRAYRGLIISSLTFLIIAWLMSNAVFNDPSNENSDGDVSRQSKGNDK